MQELEVITRRQVADVRAYAAHLRRLNRRTVRYHRLRRGEGLGIILGGLAGAVLLLALPWAFALLIALLS